MMKSETEKLLSSFLPIKKNIQTMKRQLYMIDNLFFIPYDNTYKIPEKGEKLSSSIHEAIDDAIDKCKTIEELIQKLPDPYHQAILRMRYIEGLSWRSISERINYCQDYCIRLKNSAIKKLEKLQ